CKGRALPAELSARAWILADLRLRVNDGNTRRARKRARELAGNILQVAGAHNVVAIKHRARLVAGHLHRDALRDAGVDHIPHRGAPEVVPMHPRDAGRLAGCRPRLPEVPPGPVRRSSRIQIPLELPVEVLVRPDVEDFDDVSLRVELVGKEKLERLNFELDDPHTLDRSDLRLAEERVGDDALDDLIHLELRRRREPPLRLPEAG